MAKLKVALLFGGVSSEHEISCISGASVADNLDSDKYEVIKIGITKKGRWLQWPGSTDAMRDGSWSASPDCAPCILSPDATTRGIITNHGGRFDTTKVDVVFPVLHGSYGEDGTVQGLLDMSFIPYVGCGVLASAMCMDKDVANTAFVAHGIPHTPWVTVLRREIEDVASVQARVEAALCYPVFVKPACCGSSVGVTKVKNAAELAAALKTAGAHDSKIIIEQGVVGREIECAVLGNHEPFSTLPGEVVSCNEVYDYEAKYMSGDASRLLLPAPLGEEKQLEVQQLAVKAYTALNCTGLSRVDFFLQEDGTVLLNEINTLPGFTPISMYAKLMDMTGIPFAALLDNLIQLAFERAEG